MNNELYRLSRGIADQIETELDRLGLLYRIFHRAKSKRSIDRKLKNKSYSPEEGGKKMQDLIGIRVAVYFQDDLDLVYKALRMKFRFQDETVDDDKENVFQPKRVNLIFRLDSESEQEMRAVHKENSDLIDGTYEIQLRTILSEGWHEIEHDLRYKCSDDWDGKKDLSRTLNGIYASLETSDWSILTLFEKLSYDHYKNGNLEAMMRNKFRIRFLPGSVSYEVKEVIEKKDLIKKIFKLERKEFMATLLREGINIPLTHDNLIYLINHYYLKSESIKDLMPKILKTKIEAAQPIHSEKF